MARTVFITGATGKLGRRLVKLLVTQGDHVVGLARSETAALELVSLGAVPVLGDWANLNVLRAESAKADVVVLAAFPANQMTPESCTKEQTCIAACAEALSESSTRNKKTLVFISGTMSNKSSTEESVKVPNERFPRHVSEELVWSLDSEHLRTISLRLSIMHEAESMQNFLLAMIAAAKENGFSAYIDPAKVWPSCHFDDAARLAQLAIDHPSFPGKTLHAVAEEGVSTKTIADWIGEELGVPSRIVSPEEALRIIGMPGALLNVNNRSSSALTREWMGWTPVGPTLMEDLRAHGIAA